MADGGAARLAAGAEGTAEVMEAEDTCTLTTVRRVAAMLDQDPARWRDGDPLPRGWHVALFAPHPAQATLRADGYTGPGVPLPDAGLPRLVFGGRRLAIRGDIPIGARLLRRSRLLSAAHKQGRSGRMLVATVAHSVLLDGQELLAEEQDFVCLPETPPRTATPAEPPAPSAPATPHTPGGVPFVADERMLLRFCALTFNTHRIHYDHPYATGVEGYEALVVNGSLTGLLLTELFRARAGREPVAVTARNLRPLFCGRRNTLHAELLPDGDGRRWRLWAEDHAGRPAAEMTAE